jgi:DNA mismatch endonuclease (patch repair protein)
MEDVIESSECCKIPKSNTEFWVNKIRRNMQRDKEEQRKLAQMGWHSIVVWECELKPKQKEQTLDSIAFTLNSIYLQDRQVPKPYEPVEPEYQMAAEEKMADG